MLNLSLADSNQKYLIIQVRPKSGEINLHVQIFAPEAAGRNRNYGFSWNIKVDEITAELIGKIIDKEKAAEQEAQDAE